MAAVKKPRGRVWENRETMLLLEKWGDENIQTKLLSCTRKKPIWQEISAFLRAAGYEDRDEDACKTRIHTLVSAYRSYKDECGKTGNGTPRKKPAFFNEVDEFLSGKPCTKPKSVVNSSQIVIGDSTEDCDEERRGNVENVVPNLTSSSSSSSSSDNNNKASKCPEPEKDACVTCTETTTTENEKPVHACKSGTKKRKLSTTDAFAKVDKALEAFVSYQQAADRRFMEAEEARERRDEEREEKRRKEDQEFLLKLAQVLQK